jgi:hypothetical protein
MESGLDDAFERVTKNLCAQITASLPQAALVDLGSICACNPPAFYPPLSTLLMELEQTLEELQNSVRQQREQFRTFCDHYPMDSNTAWD